jgi:CotH kinase protein/Chitobiase/beta-hexosaminidase C-terminal domain
VQEFDGLELRNGSHDMLGRGFYMSNLFSDQVLTEMGHLAPHGRFVHVYLNGSYWGLYHMRERWNAAMHSSYLGGTKDDYEAINGNYNVGGWASPATPFDGDGAAWEYLKTHRTNYAEVRGLLDVKNYTDYMITWMFGNSEDEWRAVSPNRLTGPGSGSRYILNDADGWLSVNGSNAIGVWDSNDNNTARASTWNGTAFTAGRTAGDGPGALLSAMYLTAGADYRTLLADRIHYALFNDGPLTPAANQARLNTMCQAIARPFLMEGARWGSTYRLPADPPGGAEVASDWEDAWAVCRDSWMPGRTATVLTQFRNAGLYPTLNAPVFAPNGGTFSAGVTVSMTVASPPVGSAVYYTLNGPDPRLPGGAVNPATLTYSSPVPLTVNSILRARTRDSSGNWSALQERFYQLDTSIPCPAGSVVPAELHFNPSGDDDAEFIELLNVSSAAVNLRGCRFTAGITFAFSEYRDTLLAPGQRLVLVDSEFVHRARYGWDREIGGIYFDNLNNGGEQLTFVCGATTVFDCTFDGAWSPLADSGGYSLTLIRPAAGQNLSDAANWRASATADGTPGTGDSGPAFTGAAGSDADHDGSTALLEYVFATSDTDASQRPAITWDAASPESFSFEHAAAADDAVLIPEISNDLSTWLSGPANLKIVSQTTLPSDRIRTLLQPQPGAVNGTRYYIRARAAVR